MSYSRRSVQKRGGRIKNNYTDNLNSRRAVNETTNVNLSNTTRNNVLKSQLMGDIIPQNFSDFYDDPKTVYLLCKYYLGNFVTIKTDNDEFHGVLKAVSPNGDFCLSEVTIFLKNSEYQNRNEKFKIIPVKDIRVVEVKEVDTNMTPLDNDRIPTDEEIVQHNRMSRETTDLNHNQPPNNQNENSGSDIELTPFYDSSAPSDDCLNVNKVGAHWFPPEEMFEKNKVSFNVQSTYSENLEGYTTQLHTDDPEFEKEIMLAQKKADEIERNRDKSYDELDNRDEFEDNDERVYCSVPRTIKLPANTTLIHHKPPTLAEQKAILQHQLQQNLNPNAREFTPTLNNPTMSTLLGNPPFEMIGPINFQLGNLSLQGYHPNLQHHPSMIPAQFDMSSNNPTLQLHHPPPHASHPNLYFPSHMHPNNAAQSPFQQRPPLNLPPGTFYSSIPQPQFIVPATFDPNFLFQHQQQQQLIQQHLFHQHQQQLQQQQQHQQQQQQQQHNSSSSSNQIQSNEKNDANSSSDLQNDDVKKSQNNSENDIDNDNNNDVLEPNFDPSTSIASSASSANNNDQYCDASSASLISSGMLQPKFIYGIPPHHLPPQHHSVFANNQLSALPPSNYPFLAQMAPPGTYLAPRHPPPNFPIHMKPGPPQPSMPPPHFIQHPAQTGPFMPQVSTASGTPISFYPAQQSQNNFLHHTSAHFHHPHQLTQHFPTPTPLPAQALSSSQSTQQQQQQSNISSYPQFISIPPPPLPSQSISNSTSTSQQSAYNYLQHIHNQQQQQQQQQQPFHTTPTANQ